MEQYRFSYHTGELGGVVTANGLGNATTKVMNYLVDCGIVKSLELLNDDITEDEYALVIWPCTDDDYYDPKHPDVINCYGY